MQQAFFESPGPTRRVVRRLKELQAKARPLAVRLTAQDLGERWAELEVPAPDLKKLQALARVYLERSLSRREMKELLWQAVNELPSDAREVYVLRDVEDLSGEEVAQQLRISLAAMKSRLHRAFAPSSRALRES